MKASGSYSPPAADLRCWRDGRAQPVLRGWLVAIQRCRGAIVSRLLLPAAAEILEHGLILCNGVAQMSRAGTQMHLRTLDDITHLAHVHMQGTCNTLQCSTMQRGATQRSTTYPNATQHNRMKRSGLQRRPSDGHQMLPPLPASACTRHLTVAGCRAAVPVAAVARRAASAC